MKISVIGLGNYGMAIALSLAKNKDNKITIWTEKENLYNEYKKTKKLEMFKDIKILNNISISNSYEEVLKDTAIIYIVTASKYVESVCKNMKPYYKKSIPICIASKGIEESSEELLSYVVANELKTRHIAVISGPTFAIDIINNEPVALALASTSIKAQRMVMNTLRNDNLKIRVSNDIIGIQICGAIKNVYAIASGIISGLGYCNSSTAFLINESIHDIKDIIYYYGGKPKTILSYAGVGDLMLTCSSTKSRNFSFGYIIGSNNSEEKIKKYLSNNTVEGYYTLSTVYHMLKKKGLNIGLINILYDIVYNLDDPHTLIKFLINKE